MRQTIVVFDFETTHLDPESDLCDPVEIGAIAINSKTLKVIPGSEFYLVVKPDNIDKPDYYETHQNTIDWHVGLHKDNTVENLMEKWQGGTPEKQAWSMFHDYVNQYNYAKKYWSAPVAGGANIANFDLKIYNRLNKKYNKKPCFQKRDFIDTMQCCFYWFAFSKDPPKSYSMDELRPYFGMGTTNAHNALQDVNQEAELICMFMSLYKKFSQSVSLRNVLNGH